jgi:lauroyl/myristoyl acyltransferase
MAVSDVLVAAAASADAGAPAWHTHRLNRAGAYRAAALLAAALPRRARLALAAALGARLAAWLPAEAAAVRASLARMAPALGPARREALTADVFRHFAMCFVDLLTTNRAAGDPGRLLAAVEGAEHLPSDRARGLVVVTAHVGNWEIAGRLLAGRLARPVHVVVAPEVDPGVERMLRGAAAPVRFIVRRDPRSVLALVPALRRGEVVAMQADRALGGRGDVAVPFFGTEAPFPLGPFALARAVGVDVVPAFCLLGADRRYTIALGAPISPAREGERAALGRWVAVLEATVRARPEQWFNFFDVWRSLPAR